MRLEEERIRRQRALWADLPEFGPGGAAVEALKVAIIGRVRELLDSGDDGTTCDALLEFIPEKDAHAFLNDYFGEDL